MKCGFQPENRRASRHLPPQESGPASQTRWSRLSAIALIVFGLLSQTLTPSTTIAAAPADEVTALQPGQDRAFYLPIFGEGIQIERLREKELAATERFLRKQGISLTPSLLPVTAKELYLQAESSLAMDLHRVACKGKERGTLSDGLARAQARLLDGEVGEARKWLDQVRAQMPCSEERLTRAQMAELFIWSGLTHEAWPTEPALAWLRTGLSVDPEQAQNPRLPTNAVSIVKKAAYEVDRDVPRVDLHMPQDEGPLWSLKNLTLDGRRLVFEKLFIQLTPGMHYLQLSLPNERNWGTFIELEPGSKPDLAESVRKQFGLRERFQKEIQQLLFEGFASPAFIDGLKLYTLRLKRDKLLFTALTEEDDGSWITARQFSLDGTISVPAMSLATADTPTASVPLILSQPYTLDAAFQYSGMLGPTLANYRTPGSALTLDFWRLLGAQWRVGLTTAVGARAFLLSDVEGNATWQGNPDLELGVAAGYERSLGAGRRLLLDAGYRMHLTGLRGIPVFCNSAVSIDPDTGLKSFNCSPDDLESPDSYRFNLSALPHGPRLRVGLELKPFYQRLLTMRMVLRMGYSPLLISLPDQANITLKTQDLNATEQEEALLHLSDDIRTHWLHQLDLGVGITGTY